jgi:hypothetical protein
MTRVCFTDFPAFLQAYIELADPASPETGVWRGDRPRSVHAGHRFSEFSQSSEFAGRHLALHSKWTATGRHYFRIHPFAIATTKALLLKWLLDVFDRFGILLVMAQGW